MNKISCRYCNCKLTIEGDTAWSVEGNITKIDIYSCQHCKTPFSCAETSGPKSRIRKFYTQDTMELIQEELILKKLSVDICYDEKLIYIGSYIPNAQGSSYHYEVLTSFPIFDAESMTVERIEKKIKLYMVLS